MRPGRWPFDEQFSWSVRTMKWAGLRSHHPDCSEERLDEEFRRIFSRAGIGSTAKDELMVRVVWMVVSKSGRGLPHSRTLRAAGCTEYFLQWVIIHLILAAEGAHRNIPQGGVGRRFQIIRSFFQLFQSLAGDTELARDDVGKNAVQFRGDGGIGH
jgi:hypothetical protein